MRVVLLLSLLGVGVESRGIFHRLYNTPPTPLTSEGLGAPLDLTGILQTNGYKDARNKSEVHGIGNFTSYAGFFTSDVATGKHMFWWYFPPQDKNSTAPLLIWLQGGPGGSSLFGLFTENGPLYLTADMKVHERAFTWNKRYGMLFIDNPVGAGFSYTTGTYCTNTKTCVASNLYSVMEQFYTLFPELTHNDLYITGESYGGHYVPGMAYYIHQQNKGNPKVKIPLKGIAVGDGWIDPVNMIPAYPDLMFNTGMADGPQRQIIENYCDVTVQLIKAGKMLEAFNVWDRMLNGDVFPYPNYFHNITGSNDYDNFLRTNAPASFGYYPKFVTQPAVRKAIHVGDAVFNDGHQCEMHLLEDFMVSFVDEMTTLLESYKVLIYSGQLDVIIGAALTERFLPNVPWSGQEAFKDASRAVWRVRATDAEVAGFVRVAKGLTQVIVRAAGHILPHDQPERGYDMITRWVEGLPFPNLPNPTST